MGNGKEAGVGKLIVWNLMTLDGCFEGAEPWDLAFHELAWGPELRALSLEFGAGAQALVFGRKTYEGMAAYWPNAEEEGEIKSYMNALPKLVIASTGARNISGARTPLAELQCGIKNRFLM